MRRDGIGFAVALLLSGALHAAGSLAIAPGAEAVQIEGGGGGAVPILGEAFADLAEGARPVAPAAVATAAPAAPAATAAPVPTLAVVPDGELAAIPPAEAIRSSDLVPLAAAAAPPAAPPPPLAAAAPRPAPMMAEARDQPEPPSERPRRRPESNADTGQKAAPAGNADRNARAGAQGGKDTGAAAANGTSRAAATAGNAARSNYPGRVLRQIERTRKRAVPVRGTVLVAFAVAPSGALASVRVVRSSGDPALERAALDHIRRAAPFPPPPAGATTAFTFEFVGRR